jgi:ABC-2 type transport system ATP-binding protein
MDDVEELCSEVTILAIGRIVFSGPLSKLAAENRELDYRVITSDAQATLQVIRDAVGIGLVEDAGGRNDGEVLVVRAAQPAMDDLVVRLVRAGIAIRELAPVVSPLEAAFLALTEQPETEIGR